MSGYESAAELRSTSPRTHRVFPYTSRSPPGGRRIWHPWGVFGDPIGRAAELDAVRRLLDSLDERGGLLLFEGEPGIGKTTLMRAAVDTAAAHGHRVLSCVGSAAETELSYAALGDLLAGVGTEVLADLPGQQRAALDRALLRAAPESQEVDGHAVAAGLGSTLALLAGESPVLIAIDDQQWLDSATARVIEFCARRLPARVGLLVARRPDASSWTPAWASLAAAPGAIEVRRLEPFDPAELSLLLRERAGLALPRAMLERIHETSGGNPFFALALGRSLAEAEAVPTAALPLPESLDAVVDERLSKLDGAEETLCAVAVSAEPTAEVLERAVGAEAAHQLERAEAAGVVVIEATRVRFTHPLLASGAYARTTQGQRRRLHGDLSAAVTSTEERARHLAFAEAPEAVAALAEAAQEVRARGAPSSAADLLELALERGADPSLGVRAAEHRFDAGDPGSARELLERAIEALPPGADRARALMVLGEVRYKDDSFSAAREVLLQAHEETGADDALRVQIDLRLMFTLFNLAAPEEATPFSHSALQRAEGLGDDALLAQGLALTTISGFCEGLGIDEETLDRAIRLERAQRSPSVELSATLVSAFIYLWSGQLTKARAALDRATADWTGEGIEHALAWSSFVYTWLECWAGDLRLARKRVEAADERLGLLNTVSGSALAEMARAMVAAEAGEEEEARAACDAAEGLFIRADWHSSLPWVAMARARLELSLGDAVAAAAALEQLVPMAIESLPPEPTANGMAFAGDAAEALIAIGRLEEAESIVAGLESRGEKLDRAWALAVGGRCRGLLLAAAGSVDAAEERITAALTEHERLPMPIERGRTLLALGRVRRRGRRRRAAKDALEEAREIFETAGARLWAERAVEEIEALGLRQGAGDELTPSEERVARLAASGLTNREVAATLVVSPKTVEAHLGRAYLKLGIRSRAQLGALMAPREGDDT